MGDEHDEDFVEIYGIGMGISSDLSERSMTVG
jgi:hypothetical protein